MVRCHVIFNQPTDRADWLERCVASLTHPDVNVYVHKFTQSSNVRERRSKILEVHDPSEWIMFADPDDYAVQPGYNQYIEFLNSTEENVAWPSEVVVPEGRPDLTICSLKPHHLVALRGLWVVPYQPTRHYFSHAVPAGVHFPKVAYCWNRHAGATCGLDKSINSD